MKAVVLLFAILISAAAVQSQSIKELLYSGKLKSDTGSVVRKGDDLSTKIDTSTRKPVEPEKPKVAAIVRDTVIAGVTTQVTIPVDPATGTPVAVEPPKDNNKLWKDFIDELTGTLRTDVLPSKKIKNGTYSVLIDYEIDVDGQISVKNVSCSPESSFLADQVRERVTLSAPKMTPLLGTNGKPRKAAKKQTITVTK